MRNLYKGGKVFKKTRVLYIEDELVTAKNVVDFLEDCDFEVEFCDTVSSALMTLQEKSYDILLLDLTLPDFHGFELVKKLRATQTLPIIVISAHSDIKTKVTAFRYGVNDYMVKPISLEELEARMWALLGRFSQIKSLLDPEKSLCNMEEDNIYFKDKALELTQTEFDILQLLLENKNKVLSREFLSSSLSSISSHRSLDYHIKNLRKKMDDSASHPRYIKTEYGVGYKLTI